MDDITVRELRGLLFAVTDQELTVRELRRRLFELDDQEAKAAVVLARSTVTA